MFRTCDDNVQVRVVPILDWDAFCWDLSTNSLRYLKDCLLLAHAADTDLDKALSKEICRLG